MAARKVLIVDDSATFRHQLRSALEGTDELTVVGEASSGRSAVLFMSRNQVDCLVLNAELPELSGLEVVREIRKTNRACKILLFAGTQGQAFEAGVDEVMPKPVPGRADKNPGEMLKRTVAPRIARLLERMPTSSGPSATAAAPAGSVKRVDWQLFRPRVIVVGSSTGGPATLEKFLSAIEWPLACPMLLVQHMPGSFTTSLVERLNAVSGAKVVEGRHARALGKADVVMAPGDYHLKLIKGIDDQPMMTLDQNPPRNFVRPAVDHLFESAANLYGSRCMAVVLTGMGQDGLDGVRAIKQARGAAVIQDKLSSVVFGMPGAVHAAGLQDFEGDPAAIAALINRIAK